jgi:hypothetical protein
MTLHWYRGACKYFIGTWIDINKAGETKNLYVSDYLNRSAGYLPASDHKQNSIQIMDARSVSFKGSIELPESPAISPMAYNTIINLHFQHRVVVVVRSVRNSPCRPSSACKYFIGTWIDNRGYGFIFGCYEIDDGFEAVDYRYYSDGLETVDHGDYSDGSLFDLLNCNF